tara:strand:- start:91 stop:549 length:459 start_codon:yes stop_codon:yes gene_type:complete
MSDIKRLYQEVIFDHSRRPRNYGKLDNYTHKSEGVNPLCGDQLTIYATLKNDSQIEAITFEGSGCAITTASASIMTETVKGATQELVDKYVNAFLLLATEGTAALEFPELDLAKLEVLSGVSAFPARVKCATLAWHAVRAALSDNSEIVSTE